MSSFSQQLKLATNAAMDDVEEILQSSVIALFSVAVIKTPTETGRARNNFFVELGDQNTDKAERAEDAAGSGSLENINSQVEKLNLGGKALLFNNLPYIEVLEIGGYPDPVMKGTKNRRTGKFEIRSSGGFSQQAPNGMIRAAVASWDQIVESNS
jgi:hypothetical protein